MPWTVDRGLVLGGLQRGLARIRVCLGRVFLQKHRYQQLEQHQGAGAKINPDVVLRRQLRLHDRTAAEMDLDRGVMGRHHRNPRLA